MYFNIACPYEFFKWKVIFASIKDSNPFNKNFKTKISFAKIPKLPLTTKHISSFFLLPLFYIYIYNLFIFLIIFLELKEVSIMNGV